MTPDDWFRRLYGPVEQQAKQATRLVSRESLVREALGQTHDMYVLGEMLYKRLLGEWFDGSYRSFLNAVSEGLIPKPSRPIGKGRFDTAILIYAGHTKDRFNEWADQARSITVTSYCRWLYTQCSVQPLPPGKISPFTREAMRLR